MEDIGIKILGRDGDTDNVFIQLAHAKQIKYGHVYVLKTVEREIYKIGHSTDFKKRFPQIDCICPDHLVVVMVSCKRPRPYDLEKEIHQFIKHRRRKGEWFENISEQELMEIEKYLSPILKNYQNIRL